MSSGRTSHRLKTVKLSQRFYVSNFESQKETQLTSHPAAHPLKLNYTFGNSPPLTLIKARDITKERARTKRQKFPLQFSEGIDRLETRVPLIHSRARALIHSYIQTQAPKRRSRGKGCIYAREMRAFPVAGREREGGEME